MSIRRRPFTKAERLADYERRCTALVKRLIATEPNVDRRCQLFDAWLEFNPFPMTGGKQMENLKRYIRESEEALLRLR